MRSGIKGFKGVYRLQNPTIPWLEIINMRHRLIHTYFDINLDILWNTLITDLPDLIEELEKIMGKNMDIESILESK